jgi:hypothetical protein
VAEIINDAYRRKQKPAVAIEKHDSETPVVPLSMVKARRKKIP